MIQMLVQCLAPIEFCRHPSLRHLSIQKYKGVPAFANNIIVNVPDTTQCEHPYILVS